MSRHAMRPQSATRTPWGRRAVLLFTLLALCALLTACTAVDTLVAAVPTAGEESAAGPNLSLLSFDSYTDAETETPAPTAGAAYATVDLWLDGTQNMGGINVETNSIYPHDGRKYREGGFHYHYGSQTGWYEDVLRDLLAAAGETHVRTLRYGNETMSDAYLQSYGLPDSGDAQGTSVWRDLHTVAVDTHATLFSTFVGETMDGSFYELGSANWINRIPALHDYDLENPTLAQAMSDALSAQSTGIADGDESLILQPGRNEQQCALLSALENIDTTKLSIITVDTASVRNTTGADSAGQPIAYYRQVLTQLGVFDLGLCVGLVDFQLDYMGQMSTFSTADFSEPLLWGRVILDEKKQTFVNLGVMPRHVLTLVIGTRVQVETYLQTLDTVLAGDIALQGTRGPENGELTYTAAGQTVAQEPFAFTWQSTIIARPSMSTATQHTDGANISVDDSADAVQTGANDVPLVALSPDQTSTLTIRLPLLTGANGATLDVSTLSSATLETITSLALTQTLPNTPANQAAAQAAGQQVIAYRDTLYLFGDAGSPTAFTLDGIALEDGALVCTLTVQGAALAPGYYRLRLSADRSGEQVDWQPVPWIDGADSVNVSVTDTQVYTWETFVSAITEYERGSRLLPVMFRHAWGPYTTELYHSLIVPDFPPVYKLVHLSELTSQIRDAAAEGTRPLIRYVFEVFIPGA